MADERTCPHFEIVRHLDFGLQAGPHWKCVCCNAPFRHIDTRAADQGGRKNYLADSYDDALRQLKQRDELLRDAVTIITFARSSAFSYALPATVEAAEDWLDRAEKAGGEVMNPGSYEAISMGCKCPANQTYGQPINGGRQWLVNDACPVHGSLKWWSNVRAVSTYLPSRGTE